MPWRGPEELRIVPVDAALVVHRIVQLGDRDGPEFVDSFRSSFELGREPRRKSPGVVYRAMVQRRAMGPRGAHDSLGRTI
jgi:hypothetical protein